jgi:hypothetical protein
MCGHGLGHKPPDRDSRPFGASDLPLPKFAVRNAEVGSSSLLPSTKFTQKIYNFFGLARGLVALTEVVVPGVPTLRRLGAIERIRSAILDGCRLVPIAAHSQAHSLISRSVFPRVAGGISPDTGRLNLHHSVHQGRVSRQQRAYPKVRHSLLDILDERSGNLQEITLLQQFPGGFHMSADAVPTERRRNRLTIPRCPECDSHRTAIVVREEYVLYARCRDCAHVWPVARPGYPLPGSLPENG